MRQAICLSFVFHALLIAGVLYSAQMSLLLFKAHWKEMQAASAIQVDLTYKPTDTPMKFGEEKRTLPPPNVQPKMEAEEGTTFKEKQSKKQEKPREKEKKPNPKLEKTKSDLRNIINRIRKEAKQDDRPPPKEHNVPVSKKGEKGASGTGGMGQRALSPAEQALQSAMRRHFELEDAVNFRKHYPNALGYMALKLVGFGNQFKIVSLRVVQPTGYQTLDRECEVAIHEAVDAETFATDIIAELNGKETMIECRP